MKYPKFIEAFFSAGVASNPEPGQSHKRMTHVIEDIVIVKGDIEFLKENLNDKNELKKMKIVWLNHDYHLVVRYKGTIKSASVRPIWELGIKNHSELKEDDEGGKEWKVVRVMKVEEVVERGEGIFPKNDFYRFSFDCLEDGDSINHIFGIEGAVKPNEGHFLVFRDTKKLTKKTLDYQTEDELPLNEIHLHHVKDTNRLKFQNNYRPISRIMMKRGESHFCFITRKRKPLEKIRFKSSVIDTYPASFNKICMNSLPLIFPDGLRITGTPTGKHFSSTYLSVDVNTTDKYVLTFLKFYERVEENQLQILNQRNFTDNQSIYIEKSIGFISKSHEVDTHRKLLDCVFQHTQSSQRYPVEELIQNMVNNIPLLPNKRVIFNIKSEQNNKQIRIKERPEIPTLSDLCLRTLFKVLKVDSVIEIFKNILYEKGIFLIGKNRIIGFHVIEALSQLLYPFKWVLPKIASYTLNYNFFDSPLPLIYFIKSDKFRMDKIKGKNLIEKCLVFLEADIVDNGKGETPDLPKKPLRRLKERLEEYVGAYNRYYTEENSVKFRNSQFDVEFSQEKFDYWGIRDAFLEFMQEVTKGYQKHLKLVEYEETLHMSQVFDQEAFIKDMSSLKANAFFRKMMGSSMFAKFIESRIKYDSKEQENHMIFYDLIGRRKRSKHMPNPLKRLLDNHRGEYNCKGIDQTKFNCKILVDNVK